MTRPTRERWQEIMQWMKTGIPYGNSPGWNEIVAEIDALEAENVAFKYSVDHVSARIDEIETERDKLRERVAKLRKALEWYNGADSINVYTIARQALSGDDELENGK